MSADSKSIDVTRSRPGFTRAELLVCIAVAAVLIATLVPLLALKRSSEESNLAVCKDNLRKIGIGLLAYAQDNGGAFPVSTTIENPHTELVGSLTSQKYISDPKLFYCPSDQQPGNGYSEENLKAGVIGYFYYSASKASDDTKLSKFLRTDLEWPHELNTRLDPKSWVMGDIWFSGNPTAHASYKKGMNYLTLDGAVGFVSESPRQAFR